MIANFIQLIEAKSQPFDLRYVDLAEETITLDGEWEFYWKQLLEPADFKRGSYDKTTNVTVPGAWNGYEFQGQQLSGDGYATYRLVLQIDEEQDLIGLKIPRIFTSYKMWVNQQLVASAGEVGTSREETTPQYLPQVAFFEATEELEIIVQVANFYHRSGGILRSIKLSTGKNIYTVNNKSLA